MRATRGLLPNDSPQQNFTMPMCKFYKGKLKMALLSSAPLFFSGTFLPRASFTVYLFLFFVSNAEASFFVGPHETVTRKNSRHLLLHRHSLIAKSFQRKSRQKGGSSVPLSLVPWNIHEESNNRFTSHLPNSSKVFATSLPASLRDMMDDDTKNNKSNISNFGNGINNSYIQQPINFDFSNLQQRRKLTAQLQSLSGQEIKRELESTYGISTAGIIGKDALVNALVVARLTGGLGTQSGPVESEDDASNNYNVNIQEEEDRRRGYNPGKSSFGGGYRDQSTVDSNYDDAAQEAAAAAAANANAFSGTISQNDLHSMGVAEIQRELQMYGIAVDQIERGELVEVLMRERKRRVNNSVGVAHMRERGKNNSGEVPSGNRNNGNNVGKASDSDGSASLRTPSIMNDLMEGGNGNPLKAKSDDIGNKSVRTPSSLSELARAKAKARAKSQQQRDTTTTGGSSSPFFASVKDNEEKSHSVRDDEVYNGPQNSSYSRRETYSNSYNDYSAQQQNQEDSRDRAKLRQLQIAFEFERIESSVPSQSDIRAELESKFSIDPKYFIGVKEMAYALAVARVDAAIKKQKQRIRATGGMVDEDGCEVNSMDYSPNDISQHTKLSPDCIPSENEFYPPTRQQLIAMEYEHLLILDEMDLEWELENEYGISAKHFLGKKEMAYALAVERVDQAEKEGGFVFEPDVSESVQYDTEMVPDSMDGSAVMSEDEMMRMLEEELRHEQEQYRKVQEMATGVTRYGSAVGNVASVRSTTPIQEQPRAAPAPVTSTLKDIVNRPRPPRPSPAPTGETYQQQKHKLKDMINDKSLRTPRPIPTPTAKPFQQQQQDQNDSGARFPRQSPPATGKTFLQQQQELQRLHEQHQQDLQKKRQIDQQHELQRELRTKQRQTRQEEELQRRRQHEQNAMMNGISSPFPESQPQRMGTEIGGFGGTRKSNMQQNQKSPSPQEVVRAQAGMSNRASVKKTQTSSSKRAVSPPLSEVLKGTSSRQKSRTQSTSPPPRPEPRQRPPRSASKTSPPLNDSFGVGTWNRVSTASQQMGNFSQNPQNYMYQGTPGPQTQRPFEPIFTGPPFNGQGPNPFFDPFVGQPPPRPNGFVNAGPIPFSGRTPPRSNKGRTNSQQQSPFEPAPFTGRRVSRPSKGQATPNSPRPFEPTFTAPRVHKVPTDEPYRPPTSSSSSNPRARHFQDINTGGPRPFTGSQPHAVEDNRASPPPPVQPPPPGNNAYKKTSKRPFEPAPFSVPPHQASTNDMPPPPPRAEQGTKKKRPFEPSPWSKSPFAAETHFGKRPMRPPPRNDVWNGGMGNMNGPPPPNPNTKDAGSRKGGPSPFDRMKDMFKNMASNGKEQPAQTNDDIGRVEVVPPDPFQNKSKQQEYQRWQRQKAQAVEAEVIIEGNEEDHSYQHSQSQQQHEQQEQYDAWTWAQVSQNNGFTTIPSPGVDMAQSIQKAQQLLANPRIRAIVNKAQANPKVRNAVQECMGNPASFGQYLNDDEVGPILRELKDCI